VQKKSTLLSLHRIRWNGLIFYDLVDENGKGRQVWPLVRFMLRYRKDFFQFSKKIPEPVNGNYKTGMWRKVLIFC